MLLRADRMNGLSITFPTGRHVAPQPTSRSALCLGFSFHLRMGKSMERVHETMNDLFLFQINPEEKVNSPAAASLRGKSGLGSGKKLSLMQMDYEHLKNVSRLKDCCLRFERSGLGKSRLRLGPGVDKT